MEKEVDSSEPAALSEKEQCRRLLMISGSQFKALLLISLPLVFYACIGQIFQLIDTVIAANMSANTVSTVSFVAQLEKMIMATATAISIGGGVLIGKTFGSGDMQKFRREVNTLFFLGIFAGLAILIIIIPLMYQILRIFKMPKELIVQGTIYSSLLIGSCIFQFINTVFFAIQKAKGTTKIIMWGNLLVLGIKTALNVLTMHLITRGIVSSDHGIYFLPCATITAHLTLSVIAFINMSSRKNPFRLCFSLCEFKGFFLKPLADLSVPVFIEKFIFAFGKALVNTMCASLGTTVVGALGVSDRICGLSTNPISGFQEAESSLVANNIGAEQVKRAISFFYRTLALTTAYSAVFFIITGVFRAQIINTFAKGNAAFAAEILQIYNWERFDTILVALNTAVMGLLYGFGKTKVSMAINISRLFVFRIPFLLLFMYVPSLYAKVGLSGIGMAMCISNSCTGIVAGIYALVFIRKLKLKGTLK